MRNTYFHQVNNKYLAIEGDLTDNKHPKLNSSNRKSQKRNNKIQSTNDFLNLLNYSKALIGNSSVGIRECSFLGVPVVNIGTRQNKRDRGSNVIDVDYNETEIIDAVNKIIKNNKKIKSKLYGSGNSGNQIAELLSKVDLIFHKTICY